MEIGVGGARGAGGAATEFGVRGGGGPSAREVKAHVEWQEGMAAQLGELRAMIGDGLTGLSDDELLLRVGQYTQQLDLEVRGKLDGMKARAADGRVLAAISQEVTRQVNATPPGDRGGRTLNLDTDVTYTDANGATQTAKLHELLDRFGIRHEAGIRMDSDGLTGLRTAISNFNDDLRAQGESSQIELQQVMSRRSQMLQITSNIMAARNDSRKSIAQNIRG